MSNTTQNTLSTGSVILAFAGAIGRTFGKKPQGKAVRCQITLEKEGVIRPIAERIKSGEFLSKKALDAFKKAANGGDEGAARVLEMDAQLKTRTQEIAAYKASQNVPSAE